MLDGFKKFIARGNMVDMAVGVVMGAAVTGIVNALVDSIINPLIAAIFGKPDLSKTWNWTITNWAGENSVISFGSLLNALLNFLIIAIAVYFCIVVPINKLRDMSEKAREEFIYCFFPFIYGIYPYTVVTDKQKIAMEQAEVGYVFYSIYELSYTCAKKLINA